jgi:hypothetical protein
MRYTLIFTTLVILTTGIQGCEVFQHVSCLPRSIAVACANSGPQSKDCELQRQWIAAHPDYVGDKQ